MKCLPDASIDLIFADPPFNIGKKYASNINDALQDEDYLNWCKKWIDQSIRLLKPGASFFIYNLPKWNLLLGAYIAQNLTFKNMIAVEIKQSLPIKNRLYPAHYSLLYFTKPGSKNTFHPDRMPITCCRKCGATLKDYGGHLSKLNPKGLNLSDVWTDISPVRHKKYKTRDANELPLKLVHRIITMASEPGSVILDPFIGSGTTAIVSEHGHRHWIGIDKYATDAKNRIRNVKKEFEEIDKIKSKLNKLKN